MTVTISVHTAPASPSPARAVPVMKNANKRWPPIANRNALPYKLTVISKEKLAREATAPDPDLRRCVAHFRLHCGSVEWTEKDMSSKISSFEFEDTDEEDEPEEHNDSKDDFVAVDFKDQNPSNMEIDAAPLLPSTPLPPAPEHSPESGLLDKSPCIEITEITSKHLWPSGGGTCITVTPLVG
ncbi:hypothetical protein N7510_004516 [Penicillium lagena]|uniref:uncharacterized protein n=1 Tax=Penicillium lagena TaxID=94218 RepID=UPI002540841B|nr:uncharacterized protein N7510_004516 [Penicillium lagena]KAJ5620532.1 hypothetical protein N7510_004516 [Penicillium lagena]